MMRTGIVSSLEVAADGKRLNGSFFLSEDEEAMRLLRRWKGRKDQIKDLSKPNGVFTGGIFRIVSVTDPVRGRPYVSAKDLVQAEIVPSTYLAPSMGSLLSTLELHEGMILITCYGMNLGKVIWTRRDMSGLCASGDLIRVVPDSQRIVPGYLCAYLSSRFGWASIRKLIYEGHIKHIEPNAVSRIEVPRLSKATERKAHELVEKAARARVEANALLTEAKAAACQAWGIDPNRSYASAHHPGISIQPSTTLRKTFRFDAFYYGSGALSSDATLAQLSRRMNVLRVGDPDVSLEVFETTRFARLAVQDDRYGPGFLSISDLVRSDPTPTAFISRKQALAVRAIVNSGWLILPRVGQLQGVFGTVCFIPRHLDGIAVSDNNIRIVPKDEDEGAYLWAALSSSLCYEQIVRRACGTSIPYLDAKRVADVPVPWPPPAERKHIGKFVKLAMELRSEASACESDAIRTVEQAIEEAA